MTDSAKGATNKSEETPVAAPAAESGNSGPDITAWAQSADLADATAPVPEPGTLVLLLTGIGAGAAVFIRRRK